MRALILDDIQKIRITDNAIPECDDTEILLNVSHCSVCRTDAKMWFQGQRDLVLPRIPGHEISGYTPDSGERYIVWPAKVCHHCYYCKNGMENLCENIHIIGFHRDGGFAEYVKVPKTSLIPIPSTMPAEIACMTELLASGINAIEQAGVQKGHNVLIFGGGPAGLLLGMACKHFGAYPFIVENNPLKLRLTMPFCEAADMGISANANSERYDSVINAAPDPKTFIDGIGVLRAGGTYCLYSGFIKDETVQASVLVNLLNEVHYRQLTVIGAYGCAKRHMETALNIMEQHVKTVTLLVPKIISLTQVPSVLPEILSGHALKYVVDMQKRE